MTKKFILPFKSITIQDVALVGGKNASLGEMIQHLTTSGIKVPDGFAITAAAYRGLIDDNGLTTKLSALLNDLDKETLANLAQIGAASRKLIESAVLSDRLKEEVLEAYRELSQKGHVPATVAVRSSATAEDLPGASFAGQHDSFLNVTGDQALLEAVQKCYISLFNDRAIKYREDNGFEHMSVFLSVGVQYMVRSDKGAAGVAFTIDPEYGNENLIYLTGAWGLGEAIVQGAVNPDEYYLFKPALKKGLNSLVYCRLGAKEHMMVYSEPENGAHTHMINTPKAMQGTLTLANDEIARLGRWCAVIENHYGIPMDIEWAKDGITNELFILQARPETIHSKATAANSREYLIHSKPEPLCSGKAVGKSVVSGRVCIVNALTDAGKVQQGDIIVADITNPDWNALLKKAVSIVTNKGGRTSHASIVARELGIPAVVGTMDATVKLHDGQVITVSCAEGDSGHVYNGKIAWDEKEWKSEDYQPTKTKHMLILSDPDKALLFSTYPSDGVGLLRIEFIISNHVRIHPMAIAKFDDLPDAPDKKTINTICSSYADKQQYFISKLAEGIAMVAASFYPREVVVRMSDFKTNEYAQLTGGKYFEPHEENPMLGFRGASRYYNDRYKEGFKLECAAIKRVRDEMGLVNVKIMIPFCRTVQEAKKVLDVLRENELERGRNGLEIYIMAEIPSNIVLAEKFADIFDGFSIGSNDLTQLTLGLDRDSSILNDLFDENDEAVKFMLAHVIDTAKVHGKKIGLCGQAPSDFPGFSRFLVEHGIDSISFNPDALIQGIENIAAAEKACRPVMAYPLLFPASEPKK